MGLSILILVFSLLMLLAVTLFIRYRSVQSVKHFDNCHAIEVSSFVDALIKICPISSKNHWILLQSNTGSPRCWSRILPFRVMGMNLEIYAASVIVKGCSKALLNMIADITNWAEWEPLSQHLVIKPFSDPLFEKNTSVVSHMVFDTQNHAHFLSPLMYRFLDVKETNVSWVLFWNANKLDWMFFFIQPVEAYDFEYCLLTCIHGFGATASVANVSDKLALKLQRIKDAVEINYVSVLPSGNSSYSESQGVSKGSVFKNGSRTFQVKRECNKIRKSKKNQYYNLLIVPFSRSKTGCTLKNLQGFVVHINKMKSTVINQKKKDAKTCGSLFTYRNKVDMISHESSKILKSEGTKTNVSTTVTSVNALKPSIIESKNREIHSIPNKKNITNLNTQKSETSALSSITDLDDRNVTEVKEQVDAHKYLKELSNLSHSLNFHDENIAVKNKSHVTNSFNEDSKVANNSHQRRNTVMECGIETKRNNYFRVRSLSETHLPSLATSYSASDNHLYSSLPDTSKTVQIPKLETISSDSEGENLEYCNNETISTADVCTPDSSDFELLLPQMEMSEKRIADMLTNGNYSASELQAEVLQAFYLSYHAGANDVKQHRGGWEYNSNVKGIAVMLKTGFSGSLKTLSYLCQTEIPVSSSDIWNIIRNPQSRFMLDETVKKVKILEELSEDQKIVYTYHEINGLIKKELTDFCLLHTERYENSKYYLAFHSIEYANCPLMEATTRGTLLPSGWIVENVDGCSESSKVTYMIQILVSSSDSMLIQELNNVVPLSVQNLKNYAMSKPV